MITEDLQDPCNYRHHIAFAHLRWPFKFFSYSGSENVTFSAHHIPGTL